MIGAELAAVRRSGPIADQCVSYGVERMWR